MCQGQPWLKIPSSSALLHTSMLAIAVNIWLGQWPACWAHILPSGTTENSYSYVTTVTIPAVTCPAACTCILAAEGTMVQTVSCVDSGLTNIPHPLPPSVITLKLQSNNIDHLGTNLTTLTLLEHLDMSNNSLTVLTNNSLCNMYHLRYLDLSANTIETIPPTLFASLAAIEELNLANNQLADLNSQQLFGLHTLRSLNLTRNVISDLSNRTFFYLNHLEVLDLSYNGLQHLPHDTLVGLVSLKHLYLHHNHLHSIQAPFGDLPQLHLLDLSFNGLTALDTGTFDNLPSLHTVDVSFNNVTYISPFFGGSQSQINTLNLGGNPITEIVGPMFKCLKHLQEFNLSQMPLLSFVSYDAFSGLHSLTLLNMSHNPQLSFLHPQLLAFSPELSVADLRSNSLPTVSKVTFHSNPHLKRLYLADNPFECDCGMAWIAQDFGSQSDYTQITCEEQPDNGNGNKNSTTLTPLHQMSWEMMQCNNVTLLNVTSLMSARIGSQLVLKCEYDADETGVLTWTTPRGLVFHYHPFHPAATAHLVDADDAENIIGSFHSSHDWHESGSYYANLQSSQEHIMLQSDGSLFIDYVLRNDAGPYQCIVHNAQHNASATITLRLDYQVLFDVKKMSYLVGFACAACFFTLNAVYVLIIWVARKLVNKRRRERLRSILESLDEYRTSQVTRIRTNYSNQLGRIRDHYHTQSLRLRLNYHTQMKRVRKGCSNQCERIRDNYHSHMGHLKEYSSHQIHQIREATNNQIVRIRDYGILQMDRVRETYKLQHQHVMKILEAMNLENCRTVVETECMRTESMMFDVDFPDFDDNSQTSPCESEYATALNSEGSSQESLCTVVNCTQSNELQVPVDVLPNIRDIETPSPNAPVNEDSSSNNSLTISEDTDNNGYITTATSYDIKETVV